MCKSLDVLRTSEGSFIPEYDYWTEENDCSKRLETNFTLLVEESHYPVQDIFLKLLNSMLTLLF